MTPPHSCVSPCYVCVFDVYTFPIEMSSWCSRYSRTCLVFIDHACFWSQCACREHVSSKNQMPVCVEELSDCTYIIAYHTQPMGNSRESSCTTDDQNTRCWLVPPVWRQAPARKDMFQPSQRVHPGGCPWEEGGSRTLRSTAFKYCDSTITPFPLRLHALSDIWAPWKCVERGGHRKCTSTNEGLKIFFPFLGFSCFFL